MSDLPQRKSPRLRGYDYSSAGGYFVTICTHEKKHLFGDIIGDQMFLNEVGKIAEQFLEQISHRNSDVEVDNFVVMPNHVHAIIFLIPVSADQAKTSISTIVGTYKAAVTREINRQKLHSQRVWQERFHDHIIRNEREMEYIRRYILFNPTKWAEDKFYS